MGAGWCGWWGCSIPAGGSSGRWWQAAAAEVAAAEVAAVEVAAAEVAAVEVAAAEVAVAEVAAVEEAPQNPKTPGVSNIIDIKC